MTALPDWLRQRALISPERLAIIADEARWTFRELDARADRAVAWLQAGGVTPGDRVAVLARNGPGFAVLVHGLGRLGAVLVPLNTRLTAAEIAWQVTESRARLLVADRAYEPTASVVSVEAPEVTLAWLDPLEAADFHASAPHVQSPVSHRPVSDQLIPTPRVPGPPASSHLFDLDAPHSLIYTSGTTGQPKGALLTYGNHWWSAVGSALNLGLRADDRWLACLPLFHVGGLAILLRGAICGLTTVVHSGFDPEAVNRSIDQDAVTIVSVVSAMLQRMLEARGDQPYPAHLRCVLLGGGPAPRPLLEACAARGLPVVQTYGLTEAASQVATLPPEAALRKLGSAGKPLMPTELRIDGADAAGVGEIVVRGPTMTPGYDGRPEATAQAWREGWFHTGDMGYLDDEGYLYVLDRRDDLIISGGENVYPAEVEAVLMAHAAVREAGVTGLPDSRWGQVPVAFVVARPGAAVSAEALQEFCRARLAGYKVPARIAFVAALPRTSSGKLLRRALAPDPAE